MKKIIWLLVPLLLFSVIAIAHAQTEATDLNDSDVSGFKVSVQELKTMFTFNQEKKVQLELELARLKLIQAKIAAKHNDTAAMEKALEAHNKLLEKVNATINAISNKGGNITGLARAIQVHERRIELLNTILASKNLTETQKAKIEAKIGHAENITAKLKALQEKLQNKTIKNEPEENETVEQNCTETDGGANYYVMGSANPCPCHGNNCPTCGIWADKCLNETTLLEYSCDNLNGEQYNCPNGCKDGACI